MSKTEELDITKMHIF